MESPLVELDIMIGAGPDADNDERDRLTRALLDEIEELDVESSHLKRGGEAQPGSRAGEELTIGSLIVSLASAGVFTALIETLKSWALRKESRSVKIETKIGDRSLSLEYSPTATSQEELTRFVTAITQALEPKAQSG